MIALPEPGRLLTIADYVALGEDDRYRWELEEGKLVMSPSPEPKQNRVAYRLCSQLEPQLPADLIVLPGTDIDLQLNPPDGAATVRCPDVIVVRRAEYDRQADEGGILRATGAVLSIEIASPGTRRTHYRIKRAEYEDAGIPYYWIVDLHTPISLLSLHLTDELGYVDDGEVTGIFKTASPCSLEIDLDQLG